MNAGWFANSLAGAFAWVIQTSWQASILIGLVLLLRWAGRRWIPAGLSVALGFLVLVRLLMPALPFNPASITHWGAALAGWGGWTAQDNPPPAYEISAAQGAEVGMPVIDLRFVLAAWWALGCLSLLCVAVYRHWRFYRWRAAQPELKDPGLLALLEECRAVVGWRGRVSIVKTPPHVSPAACGVVRPTLLWPEGLERTLSRPELRMILLHELIHLKKRDPLLNWVLVLVRAVHWFNPLVWMAFRRLRADREVCCDQAVLALLQPGEQYSYGRTLLKLLSTFSTAEQAPSLAAVVGTQQLIKRRIIMIKEYRQQARRGTVLASTAAVAGLCLLTFSGVAEQDPPSEIRHEQPPGAEERSEGMLRYLRNLHVPEQTARKIADAEKARMEYLHALQIPEDKARKIIEQEREQLKGILSDLRQQNHAVDEKLAARARAQAEQERELAMRARERSQNERELAQRERELSQRARELSQREQERGWSSFRGTGHYGQKPEKRYESYHSPEKPDMDPGARRERFTDEVPPRHESRPRQEQAPEHRPGERDENIRY